MLELINVTKQFGNHIVLNNISASIPKGEIIGLLGQNGAGKTTILRLLTGILKPDLGTVLIDGYSPTNKNQLIIGYLPEERGLYKKMSVYDLLLYLGRLKGLSSAEAKVKARTLLQKFDLLQWCHHLVGSLSKGMQQKIQFITAVIHEPTLLILDEPFSGFDPLNAELLKKEIKSLHQLGTTIILSTHRMDKAEELCTYLLMINNSKIVLDGKKDKILATYKTNYINLTTEEALDFIPQSFSIRKNEGFTYLIELWQGKTNNDVLLELIGRNQKVVSFIENEQTINDIFIKKTTENFE